MEEFSHPFDTGAGWKPFLLELVGRFLLVLVIFLAFFPFRLPWWYLLVAPPIIWQVWDFVMFSGAHAARRTRIRNRLLKIIADVLAWAFYTAYIAYSIVSIGLNIGHWYGWLIGIIVGFVVAHLFGLLWPQRWTWELMAPEFPEDVLNRTLQTEDHEPLDHSTSA